MNEIAALVREFGLPAVLFFILALSIARSQDSQTRRDNAFTAQFERQAEKLNALQVICDNQRDQLNQLRGQMEQERRHCSEQIHELKSKIDTMRNGIS